MVIQYAGIGLHRKTYALMEYLLAQTSRHSIGTSGRNKVTSGKPRISTPPVFNPHEKHSPNLPSQTPPSKRTFLVTTKGIVLTAFVQLALAASSQWLHNTSPDWSSSLWLGSGAALGCVLLGGPWMLSGVYLGLVAYHFLVSPSLPTSTALLLPLANIAETSLAWFLLIKVAAGFHLWISKQRDIAIFLIAAPWIPALTSALIAQTLLWKAGVIPISHFEAEVVTYALANAGGIILLTPLILVWQNIRQFHWLSPKGLGIAGHSLLLVILICTFTLFPPLRGMILIFLLPLIVWGVWGNGMKGATLSFFILSFLFVSLKNSHPPENSNPSAKTDPTGGTIQHNHFRMSDLRSLNVTMAPHTEEVGLLILFCVTMFPLGLAADSLRARSQKDHWVMSSLDSSLWTWSAVTGYSIDQDSVSNKIPKEYPLFNKKSRTGRMKILSKDPCAPAYLSHWVITHSSASGEPLEATGLLHCLRLEERAEKAEVSLEIAKMEVATIRSRINPHLLFNCLTGLRALIQHNPPRARNFITLLAHFLRTSVDSQLKTLISIKEELSLCRQYLALENMRGKGVTLKATVSEQIQPFKIPPMSIQTLVENAVKHGEFSSKNRLLIQLSGKLGTNKRLVILVSQPGSLKPRSNGKLSAGISLVRQHLVLMYHRDAKLDLGEIRKGVVTAILEVPIGSHLE
jgi:hypothetical protein